MMNDILSAVLSVAASVVAILLTYVAEQLVARIKDKRLAAAIADAVRCAEQVLKADDSDGTRRKELVQNLLLEQGYALTAVLDARIEAAVYRLNQEK